LVELARQLPKKERAELASILMDDEPSKEQILKGLKEAIEEVNLAKKGKIKLKSAREFINEL
jgi:TusA-related sulfurtransferase